MLMVAMTMVTTINAIIIISIGSVDISSRIGIIGGVQGLHCLPGLYNFDQLSLGRHG